MVIIMTSEKFSKWHGIDRDLIDWYPIIEADKCIGCGLCVTSCGRSVFQFHYDERKAVVVRPNNCLVGCQTCSNICYAGAITFEKGGFSPRERVQSIIKELKAARKVREELQARRDTLQYNVNAELEMLKHN